MPGVEKKKEDSPKPENVRQWQGVELGQGVQQCVWLGQGPQRCVWLGQGIWQDVCLGQSLGFRARPRV